MIKTIMMSFGSLGELFTRLAYIITRTEPYAAKPLNINFSGFAGLVSLGVLLFWGCQNSPNSTPVNPSYSNLTLLSPVAGIVYKVGDSVAVEWGYPKDWSYNQVYVELSITTTKAPSYKTISFPINYPGSVFKFEALPSQISDSCRIRIVEYNKNVYAYGTTFKIN
jgi:hypothetical protein